MRSKVKRTFRSKKRESGVYAATEAARLARLNSKLLQVTKEPANHREDVEGDGLPEKITAPESSMNAEEDAMAIDSTSPKSALLSTHGPRNSRREEWRKAKGMIPKSAVRSMNKQGVPSARRKAGHAKRRR